MVSLGCGQRQFDSDEFGQCCGQSSSDSQVHRGSAPAQVRTYALHFSIYLFIQLITGNQIFEVQRDLLFTFSLCLTPF